MSSQISHFLGRENDLEAIVTMLKRDDCRLVTIVGLGGIGKTTLSQQISTDMVDDFEHGVYFMPLVKITNPDDLVHIIIQSISLQIQPDGKMPFDQLLEFLSERQVLLIFDNFEQLLDGVHIVGKLLALTAYIKLLITSREVLNLADEWVYQLEGIRYPENGYEDAQYPAIQLFEHQARRIRKDFNVDNHLDAVVEICRLVRGNPLAIEIAASWSNVLDPAEIATEIQAGVAFLEARARDIPERHRSVRSVFRHSWQLLSENEQIIFRRLSLFSGDFDRHAAQTIADASLGQLTALVDKSLIHLGDYGRYEIHELLRQFGYEQLKATDEADLIRNKFVDYYLNFLIDRESWLKGHGQVDALNEIDPEFENIRMAWQWAIEDKKYSLLENSIESLHFFCDMRSRHNEAHHLISETLSQIDENEYPLVASKLEARRVRLYLFNTVSRNLEPLTTIMNCILVAEAHHDIAEIAFTKHVLILVIFQTNPGKTDTDSSVDLVMLLTKLLHYFKNSTMHSTSLRFLSGRASYLIDCHRCFETMIWLETQCFRHITSVKALGTQMVWRGRWQRV